MSDDLDLAKVGGVTVGGEEEQEQGSKGSNKKLIIIAAAAVLLLGGGAAAFFMMGGSAGSESEAADAQQQEEAAATVAAPKEPKYLAFDEAFTITYQVDGDMRYLQAKAQVMAYDQVALDRVEKHMPAVRNNLILLFSGEDFHQLSSVQGKEALRKKALETVRESVPGNQDIDDVYFTSFLMQ